MIKSCSQHWWWAIEQAGGFLGEVPEYLSYACQSKNRTEVIAHPRSSIFIWPPHNLLSPSHPFYFFPPSLLMKNFLFSFFPSIYCDWCSKKNKLDALEKDGKIQKSKHSILCQMSEKALKKHTADFTFLQDDLLWVVKVGGPCDKIGLYSVCICVLAFWV